jgi:hypothetical protein
MRCDFYALRQWICLIFTTEESHAKYFKIVAILWQKNGRYLADIAILFTWHKR